METQGAAQPEPQDEKTGVRRDLLSRGRLIVFGVLLAVEFGILFAALSWPMDQATQQSLLQQANNILGGAKNPEPVALFTTIFTNNVRVALVEMIPVLGLLVFVISIFTTGQVIQVISLSEGLPGTLGGVILLVFPFALIELSAYVIAVGSGTLLLAGWGQKRLRREVKVFVLEALLVVAILVIAAAMETATIMLPVIGLALWLPTAFSIVWLVTLLRKSL